MDINLIFDAKISALVAWFLHSWYNFQSSSSSFCYLIWSIFGAGTSTTFSFRLEQLTNYHTSLVWSPRRTALCFAKTFSRIGHLHTFWTVVGTLTAQKIALHHQKLPFAKELILGSSMGFRCLWLLQLKHSRKEVGGRGRSRLNRLKTLWTWRGSMSRFLYMGIPHMHKSLLLRVLWGWWFLLLHITPPSCLFPM
jgi:hypothetical protein